VTANAGQVRCFAAAAVTRQPGVSRNTCAARSRRHAGLAGSARLEECDHGEDAAVVIVGLLQVQLDEDAADVFLDGALLVPGKASIL
jgi:hypothetical protein